jgi:hypothetical protein
VFSLTRAMSAAEAPKLRGEVRPDCHWAFFALYPTRRALVGPVAQRLEPAAHNGLVAGSSPARPTTPIKSAGQIKASRSASFDSFVRVDAPQFHLFDISLEAVSVD